MKHRQLKWSLYVSDTCGPWSMNLATGMYAVTGHVKFINSSMCSFMGCVIIFFCSAHAERENWTTVIASLVVASNPVFPASFFYEKVYNRLWISINPGWQASMLAPFYPSLCSIIYNVITFLVFGFIFEDFLVVLEWRITISKLVSLRCYENDKWFKLLQYNPT